MNWRFSFLNPWRGHRTGPFDCVTFEDLWQGLAKKTVRRVDFTAPRSSYS
jgi:hypothetical protein